MQSIVGGFPERVFHGKLGNCSFCSQKTSEKRDESSGTFGRGMGCCMPDCIPAEFTSLNTPLKGESANLNALLEIIMAGRIFECVGLNPSLLRNKYDFDQI